VYFVSQISLFNQFAIRDKKVVGVFVRFSRSSLSEFANFISGRGQALDTDYPIQELQWFLFRTQLVMHPVR
jgi:hypothetical protein